MFGIENYFGFLIAGIILNLTPGADTIYILTRSIAQGRKAGVYSVLGICTGASVHTLLAAFGLSIILAKSIVAFSIVKYIGVAYLVYLGIKMIVEKNNLFDAANSTMETTDLSKIYRQGIFTNLFNPKVALFYLSFLPQFINPGVASGPLPFILLGLTFMTTGTIWCLVLAYGASHISRALRNNIKMGRLMQKLSGVVFIGLGLKILFDKR